MVGVRGEGGFGGAAKICLVGPGHAPLTLAIRSRRVCKIVAALTRGERPRSRFCPPYGAVPRIAISPAAPVECQPRSDLLSIIETICHRMFLLGHRSGT